MATTTIGRARDFIQFSRTSNATVTDRDGRIKWAGHNLLTNSESFDASAWTKSNIVTSNMANIAVAPNGTTTADALISSAVSGYHSAVQGSGTLVSGVTYTFSVFAKAAGYNFLFLEQIATGPNAMFNLSTGAVVSSAVGTTATITPMGSGWYLCSITFVAGSTNGVTVGVAVTSTWTSYLGDGVSGLHVWGAHLYRSDLGGMQQNPAMPANMGSYYPTTPRNLLGYSEAFNSWTRSAVLAFGSGSVSDAVLAPNGLQTADKIVADTTNAAHVIYQTFTSSATTYTLSFYAKAAGYSLARVADFGGGGRFYASFDLASGTVVAGSTGGSLYVSSAISSAGDGWYRCSVTITFSGAASSSPGIIGYPSGATLGTTGATYTGDGVSGIYLWGAQLSDSASLDPYVPVYGAAVTSAAYYAPRLDYSSTTLQPLGLLVEEQRTNLLSYSADFADIYWAKSGSTISADAVASPGGDLTADKLVEAGTDAQHRIAKTIGVTSGVAYTFSVYVKAGERTAVWLRVTSTVTVASITVNLSNGSVESPPVHPYSVTNVGNGWYRVTITGTPDSSTATCYANIINNTGANTYLGDGTSGIYIWGAQLEAGSFATSYIPTGSATATRAADVASVSTQAFPYSSSASSIVLAATVLGSGGGNRLLELSASASDNGLMIYQSSSLLRLNAYVDASSAILGDATVGAVQKVGIAYDGASNGAVRNGGTVSSVGTTVSAAATKLSIGTAFNNGSVMNGHIRQITYLPRRISNAELQSRTL